MLHALAPLALLAPLSVPQEVGRALAPEAMREDLLLLSDTLASQHAGLRRYAGAEELDGLFGEVLAELEEPRDVLWFYRRVSGLLGAVRCGHTRASLAEGDRRAALASRGVLPLELHWVGPRAWVRRVLDERVALRPGQELRSIDGLAPAELRARMFARLSGDGFVESGKESALRDAFAELYALLLAEGEGPYRVEALGAAAELEVAGIAPEAFAQRRGARAERPVVRLELADGAGILTVSEFGDPPAGEPGFEEALEASFRTLRERGVRRLILDLRGNGGGRDMYGARLVSYLSPEPFRYFERIEVTPEYDAGGRFEVVERDGRRLMLSHGGLELQQPAEMRFEGDVAILIDGRTFSTAADVATVAHHLGLATFLGEETSGGYDGNTSGDSMRLVLPESRVTVGVPKWMYTTANVGHELAGRGVVPDVAVVPGVEDVVAGRDVGMERAVEWARKGR